MAFLDWVFYEQMGCKLPPLLPSAMKMSLKMDSIRGCLIDLLLSLSWFFFSQILATKFMVSENVAFLQCVGKLCEPYPCGSCRTWTWRLADLENTFLPCLVSLLLNIQIVTFCFSHFIFSFVSSGENKDD